MAKKKAKPTADQVNDLISLDKGLIQQMVWQSRDAARSPIIYKWFSALDRVTGEIIEDLRVITQWRSGPYDWQGDSYEFGLYFMDDYRILAHDYGNNLAHKNHKGFGHGLPFYEKEIRGPHAHIWTTKGYNYAEPIELSLVGSTMKDQWDYFCSQAGILRNTNFADPKFEAGSGQGRLI